LPLRFVTAPVGAGKTTAIVGYLATREATTAYVALDREDTLDRFRARIAGALEFSYVPASADALGAALATLAPCEIVIDDVDHAPAETIEEIVDLVRNAPIGVAFVLAARSRTIVDAPSFIARGFGAALEARALAFTADDLARLCDLHGVTYATPEIARFLEETEGWPLVANWVLRDAAGDGASLGGAFDRWRKTNARHLRDFIDTELHKAGPTYYEAFRAALRGSNSAQDRDRLALLEGRGLFVTYVDGAYRPYRVARQLDAEALPGGAPAVNEVALLVVRMFGRFEASIGERKIEWIRRREAQIVKYLLLKPDGSATRAELLTTFWPGADGHAATQSLRTASSNIRKAFAAIVGYAEVERYFSSRGDVAVALERTVIDVRRFSAHVADGDVERERGRVAEAFAHYRAAESIYAGELLGGEYPEPWYVARAAIYAALFLGVLERLAEYHTEAGHVRHAGEYAARARQLRAREPRLSAPSVDG
jgi:hypothetical protein